MVLLPLSFMTYGWRDPYYYAIAGWLAFFLPRAVGRILLVSLSPLNANTELMIAIMGDADRWRFYFLNVAKTPSVTPSAPEHPTLQKIMALSDTDEIAALDENAIQQGVTLFRSRRARSRSSRCTRSASPRSGSPKSCSSLPERCTSTSKKTGLHSRQEILDHVTSESAYWPHLERPHAGYRLFPAMMHSVSAAPHLSFPHRTQTSGLPDRRYSNG